MMGKSVINHGQFDGNKLKLLRLIRGWTMKETADSLHKSATFISMLEKNQCNPGFQTIIDLSRIFNVKHSFFLNNQVLPKTNGPIFFRERVAVPKRNSQSAKSKNIILAYVMSIIRTTLPLHDFSMPSYAHVSREFRLIDFDKIDQIATAVRKQFDLGIGPISNMTLLVERLGIHVSFQDLQSDQIDALTAKIGGHYYITINNVKHSSVRIRFNIAHELGHILLHSGYSQKDIYNKSQKKRIENEAQHFAGALLMPEKGIALDMAQSNMSFLKALKKHWKVSLAALIYRGNEIGLISDKQALFLNQTISRNGWRKHEPYDDSIPAENPTYINSAVQYLVKDKKAFLQRISDESGIPEKNIAILLGLNVNKFNGKPKLHIVK